MQSPILIVLVLATVTAVVRSGESYGYDEDYGGDYEQGQQEYGGDGRYEVYYGGNEAYGDDYDRYEGYYGGDNDGGRGYKYGSVGKGSYGGLGYKYGSVGKGSYGGSGYKYGTKQPKTTTTTTPVPSTEAQTTAPPVDGNWGPWSTCSSCSVSCGTGSCTRTRLCDSPAPSNGGLSCPGPEADTQACSVNPLPVSGAWSGWQLFGRCSATCGAGIVQRIRFCSSPVPLCGGNFCPGNAIDTVPCNYGPCPVDGQWSPWSACSACSVSCGSGFCSRRRACNSPSPSNGGRPCQGSDAQTEPCSLRPARVSGGWSAWQTVGQCSATCGAGTQPRVRTCTNPVPLCGGDPCPPGAGSDSVPCSYGSCPVDGNWSPWSTCSSCSVSCGTGSCTRTRLCDSPAPSGGGRVCAGPAQLVEQCTVQPLPADGVFEDWSPWGVCSVTCNGGQQSRRRSCVPAVCGGANCVGDPIETQNCNTEACPTPSTAPQTTAPAKTYKPVHVKSYKPPRSARGYGYY